LVITVDISGSVSEVSLDKFLIECAGAIDMIKPQNVTVLWTREYVYGVDEVTTGEELLTLARPSCGGTRMSAGVEWVEDNGILPDLHLIFTDGEMDADDYAGVAAGENVVMVFDRDIETSWYFGRYGRQTGVRYVCVKN
jgi:predicted metal-dependent peptidase